MKTRCPSYCGITCVDGSCPNALADEYPEYGYEHCTCEECGYYEAAVIAVSQIIQNIVLNPKRKNIKG